MTLTPKRVVFATPPRILLVDENADWLEALSALLEMSGYEVSVARDGDDGVRLAKTLRPDAVVMDLRIPNCDSYETIQRIKMDDLTVVAFTADADGERAARAAGADWFVLKPDSETLERALACITRNGVHRGEAR